MSRNEKKDRKKGRKIRKLTFKGQLSELEDLFGETDLESLKGPGKSVPDLKTPKQSETNLADLKNPKQSEINLAYLKKQKQSEKSLADLKIPKQSETNFADLKTPKQSEKSLADLKTPKQSEINLADLKNRKGSEISLTENPKQSEKSLTDLTTSKPIKGYVSSSKKLFEERLARYKQKIQEATSELNTVRIIQNTSEIGIAKPRKHLQGATGRKGNLQASVAELASFELSEPDESELFRSQESDQKKASARTMSFSPQQNVRTTIRKVTAGDATQEAMKKPEVSSKPPSPPSSFARPAQSKMSGSKDAEPEIDDTLEKKQFREEEIDYLPAERGEDHNKWYKWVENSMEKVLIRVAVLTLIAAALTAVTCYMFVKLPNDIYSTHILREIYWINDNVIAANGFSKDFGIHSVTPLPVVVGLMYLTIFYIVYMIQYPKKGEVIMTIRYTLFLTVQAYLTICLISYMCEISLADKLLDDYYEHDKKGLLLKGWPEGEHHSEPLHGLYHSQEYLGCCGYRDRNDWAEVFPDKYNRTVRTYPLTCCDEERSGIACYDPVEENVTYTPPDDFMEDEMRIKGLVTKQRLHEDTCHEILELLFDLVSSTIIILLILYIALSNWTIWTLMKICEIVIEKDITIVPGPQYIDSL